MTGGSLSATLSVPTFGFSAVPAIATCKSPFVTSPGGPAIVSVRQWLGSLSGAVPEVAPMATHICPP